MAGLEARYKDQGARLAALRASQNATLLITADGGKEKDLPLGQVVDVYFPNAMSVLAKSRHYVAKVWEFVSDDPRESNTEGGVFPAIFGTVMMVLIMSVLVTPLGVLAAFYLREYAKQGPFVSAVRIAVNNLAGVPSIVFGVFGVGFFIYFVGGSIDRLFFAESLPAPTYGTGGILWASLTLALLTVPVVIVATEEGLAAIPRGVREASLALSATKLETTLRVVLPAVMPSILTGLILAMARAAGEVAPLMITGVVKLAPSLPVDGYWPFVHLDRKFMHLGFHIYDVGFQSPNVDAARPMVFATTCLLLLIVVLLNMFAITMRSRLRRQYATFGRLGRCGKTRRLLDEVQRQGGARRSHAGRTPRGKPNRRCGERSGNPGDRERATVSVRPWAPHSPLSLFQQPVRRNPWRQRFRSARASDATCPRLR